MPATIQLRLCPFALMSTTALSATLVPEDQLGLSARSEVRERQLLGRAYRRGLLAAALAAHPADLVFANTALGKPYLRSHPLSFNCSHSRGAYALAWSAEIASLGVDTEDEGRVTSMAPIARSNFTVAEHYAWEQTQCSTTVWLTIWTRKEAALKYLGTGIRMPLDTVETGSPLDAQSLVDGPCGRLRLCSWRRQGQVLSLAYPAGDSPVTIVLDDGALRSVA